MPAFFLGHWHPENALKENSFTNMLKGLHKTIEKPNAVMIISAHWTTEWTYISTNKEQDIIYDFSWFSEALYNIKYPAYWSESISKSILSMFPEIKENKERWLDHWAWALLKYMYPNADVPVFQLSVDMTKDWKYHFDLGKKLRNLRKKGILIVSSWNIVHNLSKITWEDKKSKPYYWAKEFDEYVKWWLNSKNFKSLYDYSSAWESASLSVPTSDHYFPMLYILWLMEKDESVSHIFEQFEYGSLSMRSFKIS